MSDYGVEFKDLGACVEFLSLTLRNRQALHLNRNDVDEIIVSGSSGREYFTVLIRGIHPDSFALLRRLARVPGLENAKNPPGGKSHTINKLLQRIRLIPRMESPGANGVAVALFDAKDRQYRDWHTQLLDMGCGDIRVGFIEPRRESDGLTHLLLVGQVPKGFCPPGDWTLGRDREAVRAVAFYRLHNATDCPYYVEWDYEHPLTDLDHLYDLTDTQSRMVLICADSPRNNRAGRGQNKPAKMEPRWLCLEEREFGHIFQFQKTPLYLPQDEAAPSVYLTSRSPSGDAVLDLHVKRDSRSVTATAESIENDIAWHQRAIEDLVRDHRTAHLIRRENIYLAFVFRQMLAAGGEDTGPAPALNPSFRRLLEQPYGYLQHMKYGFYEDPHPTEGERYGLHVVIDTRPATHSQLLTQLADEVFIQRADWHEWHLPLFVRYGDEIRPRLEDESLVSLIRTLLWEGHADPTEPVLLRTLPQRDGDDGRQPWEILYVTGMKPLTDLECFRFLNDRFSAHLLEFRRQIPQDVEEELTQSVAQATRHAMELQEQVLNAAEEGISTAETHWQVVDENIRAIEGQTRTLADAVGEMERTIESTLATWDKFFLSVLKSNQTLMQGGVAAFKAYESAHTEALQKMTEYEQGLQNVNDKLTQDNQALEDRRKSLVDVDGKCGASEKQLKASLKDVSDLQSAVMRRVAEVDAKVNRALLETNEQIETVSQEVDELDGKIQALREAQFLLQERKAELESRKATLQRMAQENETLAEENEDLARENEKKSQEIDVVKQDIARERHELDEKRRELSQRFKDHQDELLQIRKQRHEVDEQTDKLDSEIKQIEPVRRKLEADQTNLQAKEKRLEDEKAKLDALKKKNEAEAKQLGTMAEEMDKEKTEVLREFRILMERGRLRGRKLRKFKKIHEELRTLVGPKELPSNTMAEEIDKEKSEILRDFGIIMEKRRLQDRKLRKLKKIHKELLALLGPKDLPEMGPAPEPWYKKLFRI